MTQKPITPQAFALKMRRITCKRVFGADHIDIMVSHREGDKLLCEVLRSLGYGQGVDLFEAMEKWYE